jgi:HEAT repeats
MDPTADSSSLKKLKQATALLNSVLNTRVPLRLRVRNILKAKRRSRPAPTTIRLSASAKPASPEDPTSPLPNRLRFHAFTREISNVCCVFLDKLLEDLIMKFLNYGVPTTSVVLSRTLVRASFNLDRKQTKRDEDEFVRRTAVEELARGWKDDPDALPWLKDRAAREENELVRSVAVQELARGQKDLLVDRARND